MSIYSIAGVRPQELGLHTSYASARPVLPTTRDLQLVIPGRNGAWDFGGDMEPRFFSFSCAFVTRSPVQLQQNIEAFARLLVDHYGKPKTVPLVLAEHPDRTYDVRYSGSIPIDRLVGMGQFSLPLVAFEPYAQGPEQVSENVVTSSPYETTIHSEGEIRTEPVITLTNEGTTTITKFRLTNEYRLE